MNFFWLFSLVILLITETQAFVFPKQTTKTYQCEQCNNLSHDILDDKWDVNEEALQAAKTNGQQSYSYKEPINAQQLQQGILIWTSAPGAVLHLSPLQGQSLPPLNVLTPSKQTLSLKNAASLFTENETTYTGNLEKKPRYLFQLKPSLGFGLFMLQSKESYNKTQGNFLIHVFDKYSTIYLQVETDALHYQYGDELTATIALKGTSNHYPLNAVKAQLVGPKGQTFPLTLTEIEPNTFQGETKLLSELNDQGENWYLEASIQTEKGSPLIKRSGHAAFSYSIPSASLLHIKKVTSHPLTFVATLDVATGSRYAIQAVLFHKKGSSATKPIETTQKAQWLEPGKHLIQFTFDNSRQLVEDTLYLGYLRILDYGQLKTVYQFDTPIQLNQLVD